MASMYTIEAWHTQPLTGRQHWVIVWTTNDPLDALTMLGRLISDNPDSQYRLTTPKRGA